MLGATSEAPAAPQPPHPLPCTPPAHALPAQAIDLEAVCKSRQHGLYVPPDGKTGHLAEARWVYKCRGRPWVLRLVALAAGGASLVVLWSECTIGSGRSPDLSPLSLALRSGAVGSEFWEQALVALPLCYMCACAYFSLLKLGNFSFYHVVQGGTWAYSLLLSSSQMARFAAPLCFNFLHVIRMNDVAAGDQVGGRGVERVGGWVGVH